MQHLHANNGLLPGRPLFEAEVNLISDPGYRSLSEAGSRL